MNPIKFRRVNIAFGSRGAYHGFPGCILPDEKGFIFTCSKEESQFEIADIKKVVVFKWPFETIVIGVRQEGKEPLVISLAFGDIKGAICFFESRGVFVGRKSFLLSMAEFRGEGVTGKP